MKRNQILLSIIVVLAVIFGSFAITASAAGDTYVVAGDPGLCGSSWSTTDTANAMTLDEASGCYYKIYTNVTAGEYNVKTVKNGSDWYGDSNGWNVWVEVTATSNTVIVIFDPSTSITWAGAVATVAGEAGLCGSGWDTAATANDMTYDASTGLFTKVYENVAAGTYQYKVAMNHKWDLSYGKDGGSANQSVYVAASGSRVTVTFNPFTKAVEAEVIPLVTVNGTAYSDFSSAMTAANALAGDVVVNVGGEVEFINGMELNGSYDSITFNSVTENAKITVNQSAGGDYITAHGKTVIFNDLILAKANPAWSGNSGHMGNYFSIQGGTATYNNCTFSNGACTSGGTATYNNCTFQNTSEYGLWVYDDAIVTVSGGTIDSAKGIKAYSEDESTVTATLTVENATFTENVTKKPAVAIGYAAEIKLIGNTYKNTTGELELDSGSDANCEGITFVARDAEGNDISASISCVDKANSSAACGVLMDGAIYTSVATACEAATADSTVTLLYDTEETVEFPFGVELDANGHTAENVTVAPPAASVGGVEFASVLEAINAAADGATIQLIAGAIDEEIVLVNLGKTITIVGADDFGTVLTGGIRIGTDDNNLNPGSVTIKGIAFEGRGVKLVELDAASVIDCKFTGIDYYTEANQKSNNTAILVIADNFTNAVITGNVIDGAQTGIRVRNSAGLVIENNKISNTLHNSITIEANQYYLDNDSAILIKDNDLSDWGISGEGRAIRLKVGSGTAGKAKAVTITGNTLTRNDAPENFIKITELEDTMTLAITDNMLTGNVKDDAYDYILIEGSGAANADTSDNVTVGANEPHILDGYWWIGATNTGVNATGTGIAGVELNADGELIVKLDDAEGTELNLGKITGEDGLGINDVTVNTDGELVITYTEGDPVNLGSIKGEDGKGISKVELNEKGELVITYTDDTTLNLGNIKGDKGDKGDQGEQGVQGEQGIQGEAGKDTDDTLLYIVLGACVFCTILCIFAVATRKNKRRSWWYR